MSRAIRKASDEILDIRSRIHNQNWGPLSYAICIRLNDLGELIGSDMGAELHRHVIVASIAALQTYHRSVIISLVDSDPVYRERAAALIAEKLPLKEALAWLGNNTVTFGELIAHSAPCNNVKDLSEWLGAILDCDITHMLSKAVSPFDRGKKIEDAVKLIPDIKLLECQLRKAFRLRHIFAHEAAFNEVVNAEECQSMHDAISAWVSGIDAVIWAVAYKDEPITTSEMNLKAMQKVDEASLVLEKIMGRALNFFSNVEEKEWLINNHKGWLANTKNWIDGAYFSKEGTIWPSLGRQELAKAILERAERVRKAIISPDPAEGVGVISFDKGEWWGL